MPYLLHLIILTLIYISIVLTFALTVGFTGLINLGHFAFVGIGAYTAALLTTEQGLSFWLATLLGGLLAGIFGWLLALPTKKIKGDYFALLSLGFSFIAVAVGLNWIDLTHGALGIAGIPRPVGFGTNDLFIWPVFGLALLTYGICWRVTTSPFGRVMQAVRDDEMAAQVLGKNTWRTKIIVMTVSAFLAGIAGSFFAAFLQYIDPSSFALTEIVLILSMLLIGGLGYLPAAVIGVVVSETIFEPLRFLHLPSEILGPLREILYSLLLLAVVVFRPKGVWGKVELDL